MRSDDVCLTVALGTKMWFDLLLLCTNYTRVHRDLWHKKASAWSTAAAAPLLLPLLYSGMWLRG